MLWAGSALLQLALGQEPTDARLLRPAATGPGTAGQRLGTAFVRYTGQTLSAQHFVLSSQWVDRIEDKLGQIIAATPLAKSPGLWNRAACGRATHPFSKGDV